MVRVKICGLTQVEHAVAAGEAGADFLGVVFAQSRRQVTAERALEIVEAVRAIDPRPDVVGVFVNAPAADVNRTARACRLGVVQLSGDEGIEYALGIERPVIKVIHIMPQSTATAVLTEVDRWYEAVRKPNFHCLLDAAADGIYGGTGKTFDRGIAREVAFHYPVIIAGGLTVENVAELVKDVKPWGVDVSSGVETNGQKDTEKIGAFIRAVWNAE
jgi:phosphoribosylanthranilate isomerase